MRGAGSTNNTRSSSRVDKEDRHNALLEALHGIRDAVDAQGKSTQTLLEQLARRTMKQSIKLDNVLDHQSEVLDKLDLLLTKRLRDSAGAPAEGETPTKRAADEDEKRRVLAERFFHRTDAGVCIQLE